MSGRLRVAITCATTLMLGALSYGHAFEVDLPGVLEGLWDGSTLIAWALAVLGVFLVYRWWALLPAIAPVAVIAYLHTLTDYVAPWREESIGSPDQPVFYAILLIVSILLHAAFLALGLLLRAAWEWVRSRFDQDSLFHSA